MSEEVVVLPEKVDDLYERLERVAEKTGYRITWKRYLNYAVPPTLIILAISNLMLVIRYLGGF